eukprot:359516-Chlamydomonas_euryale.AAC.2
MQDGARAKMRGRVPGRFVSQQERQTAKCGAPRRARPTSRRPHTAAGCCRCRPVGTRASCALRRRKECRERGGAAVASIGTASGNDRATGAAPAGAHGVTDGQQKCGVCMVHTQRLEVGLAGRQNQVGA